MKYSGIDLEKLAETLQPPREKMRIEENIATQI